MTCASRPDRAIAQCPINRPRTTPFLSEQPVPAKRAGAGSGHSQTLGLDTAPGPENCGFSQSAVFDGRQSGVMAQDHPRSHFVGNRRSVAPDSRRAGKTVSTGLRPQKNLRLAMSHTRHWAGLRRIHYRHQPRALVVSWVTTARQNTKIVRRSASNHLAPNGVAYHQLHHYPGLWPTPGIVRDMMFIPAARTCGPRGQTGRRQKHSFGFVAEATRGSPNTQYQRLLQSAVKPHGAIERH